MLLTQIIKNLIKFLKNPQIVFTEDYSIKTQKWISWTKKEEQLLLELMTKNYPFNVPTEKIEEISNIYNRTKSSVVNKIQKLKKKYSTLLERKNEQIIS